MIDDGTRARPTWVVSVLVGLAAALVSWLRLPGGVRGSLWAEDGVLFLQQWINDSLLHVVTPYDGYLHVVPRLVVGGVASLVPPAHTAVAISASCCLVVGLLAAVVHVSTADLVGSGAVRLLLAMITALGPGAAQEVLGNTANLHWYFLWATPWILQHRPRTWVGAAGAAVLVLVGGLSEIQLALFVALLPFVVRTVKALPAALALVSGVAIQVVVLLQHPRPPRAGPRPSAQDVTEGFLTHPVLGMVTGRWSLQGDIVNAVSWSASSVLGVVVLTGVVAAMRSGSRRGIAALCAVGAAVVVYAAAVLLNPSELFLFSSFTPGQWAAAVAPRYAVVPTMFLLAAVVIGLDAMIASRRRAAVITAVVVAAALTLTLAVNAVPGPATRESHPGWAASIAAAQRGCREGIDPAQLAISPAPDAVVISCARLAGWASSNPLSPDVALAATATR